MQFGLALLSTLLVLPFVYAVPAPSPASAAAQSTSTLRYASDDPNNPLWVPDSNIVPEPIRGSLGGKVLGPQNVPMDLQNPDALAGPTTDNGDV
jgi:hypothetical protein